MKKSVVFVELDALLDTRLATLASLDPEAAKMVTTTIQFHRYKHRLVDDYSLISNQAVDNAAFWQQYQQRAQLELHKQSMMTEVIVLLQDIVVGNAKANLDDPQAEKEFELVIGYGPYSFSYEEKAVLKEVIQEHMPLSITVRVEPLLWRDLHPAYTNKEFSAVILYHFDSWIGVFRDLLKDHPQPTVTFFAPAIYAKEILPKQDWPEYNGKKISPFAALEYVLSEWITLAMLPPKTFSLIELPREKKDSEDTA